MQKILPALAQSQKLQKRVRKVGFDWQDIEGVYAKIQEEIEEIREAKTPEDLLEEVGDLLFISVNLASWVGVDAEIALREANLKFEKRFREVERLAHIEQQKLIDLPEQELLKLWLRAKTIVKS